MRALNVDPCFDPDGGLWVPPRRVLWSPGRVGRAELLRGIGAIESVPAGVTFPSKADYTRLTSYGVNQLSSLGRSEMSQMMTPQGERAADVIGASISAVAGVELSTLIAGAILPDNLNSDIGTMLTALISGVVDMLLDSIGELVADIVGEALNVIPVIGAIIKLVIDLIMMIVAAADTSDEDQANYDQARINAKKKRDLELNPLCNQEVERASKVTATGLDANGNGGVVTPADIFRPIYYKYRHGGLHLPLSPYSLLIMLCGPEADGWPFSQSSYDAFIAEARTGIMYDHAEEGVHPRSKQQQAGGTWVIPTRYHGKWAGHKTNDPLFRVSSKSLQPCVQMVSGTGLNARIVPDPGLGLKPEVRSRMWSLIQAIMGATQDPSPGFIGKRWGDGGMAAMGMLMDIVFRHYEPIARGLFGDRDGYWSPFLLTAMEHRLTTAYRRTASACVEDECARAGGSCTTNLGDSLLSGMNQYKDGFLEKFLDENGRLIVQPLLSAQAKAKLKAATSRIVLSGPAAKRFADAAARSAARGDLTNGHRALLAAAGLSGSYLLFRGAKWARSRR